MTASSMNAVRKTLKMARGLSCDEKKEVIAELLDSIDPTQPKGTVLCDAIMRIWSTAAFEAVAIRDGATVPEIYLSRRAPENTAYPNEWHVPGSLYRHGERDRDVADRLEQEFGASIAFRYVDRFTTDEQRGTIHSLVFLVELIGEPRMDDRHGWFPVNNLPAPMVGSHRDVLIPRACHFYWHQRSLEHKSGIRRSKR